MLAAGAVGIAARGEDESDEDDRSRASHHSTSRHSHQYSDDKPASHISRARSPSGASLVSKNSSSAVPYPVVDDVMPTSPVEYSNPFSSRHAIPPSSNPSQIPYPQASEMPAFPAQHTGAPKSAMRPSVSVDQNDDPRRSKAHKRTVSFSQETQFKEEKAPIPVSPRTMPQLLPIETDASTRAPSAGLGPRMDRLSVSGNRPDVTSLGPGQAPPGSPMLEAYKGTYQSMSPMPSPMMLPDSDVNDIPPLTPLSESRESSKNATDARSKKRVKLYDAEGDAEKLAKALNHQEARPGPLIDILPELTHDQLLALRAEYKKLVKAGGRGVNIAKQIKATTNGNFGKICYVTALGRWESEAYWANFWYQSHSSSRELLIESLMGRTNAEIREIKDSFSDRKYHDDLSWCMEKELKPDKFRTAILMALEERKQEETDTWPVEYRNKDVETLYKAIKAKEGGESAILEIVVRRSNNHLRDVLRAYEKACHDNFARDALKKSHNLVVSMK